jgi:hypothetical protein
MRRVPLRLSSVHADLSSRPGIASVRSQLYGLVQRKRRFPH